MPSACSKPRSQTHHARGPVPPGSRRAEDTRAEHLSESRVPADPGSAGNESVRQASERRDTAGRTSGHAAETRRPRDGTLQEVSPLAATCDDHDARTARVSCASAAPVQERSPDLWSRPRTRRRTRRRRRCGVVTRVLLVIRDDRVGHLVEEEVLLLAVARELGLHLRRRRGVHVASASSRARRGQRAR